MTALGCILLCVSGLILDVYRFDGSPRLPEAPVWQMSHGVSLAMELHSLDLSDLMPGKEPVHIYWRNRVHGEFDTSQARLIGWQFEVGVKIWKIEAYRAHHSQHVLDAEHPWMRFPVQDTIGLRVYLVGNGPIF